MSNRSTLQSEVNTNFADNTSGAITPALLRSTLLDMINSMPTLVDGDSFATAAKTFALAPIFSALTGFLQGNGSSALTAVSTADAQQALSIGELSFPTTGVNLNATSDTPVAITLPAGFTRYHIVDVKVSNASISLTTAQIGLYTAASQGGVNIVAQTTTGIPNNTNATNLNSYSATVVDSGTRAYNNATLYINVGTPQGAAASADITIVIKPLP
jgi:hypothetical protein